MLNQYETKKHSIYLEGDQIFFKKIKFVFTSFYEAPWYGGILFTHNNTSTYNSNLTFHECEFVGNNVDSILFNSLQMNGKVGIITMYSCEFFGIIYDVTPDIIDTLYFVSNTFSVTGTSSRGVLDIEVSDYFEITNNKGLTPIGANTVCNGLICIKDSSCTVGDCKLNNNNFTSIPSTILDNIVYNLDNVVIPIENIYSNVGTKDDYGLAYTNMPLFECNFTNLKKIKIDNMGLDGYIDDVVCDLGETTEKSCSWPCIPDRPPPKNCTIDPYVTIMNIEYLYSLFPTIKDALEYCLSEPVQHIVFIYPGNYVETNLLFQPADSLTQNSLRIESIVDNVNIIGTNHFFTGGVGISFDYIEFYNLNFYSQLFTGPTATPISVNHMFGGNVKNLEMYKVLIQTVPSPDNQPSATNNYPDADYLLNLNIRLSDVVFTSLKLLNVSLYGSKQYSVFVEDFYETDPDNSSFIYFRDVDGKANQRTMIELDGVGEIFFERVECTTWCGKLAPMSHIIKVINKNVFSGTNFSFEIDGLKMGVTNPIVQSEEDDGIGFITGLWIENPDLPGPVQTHVNKFRIRNFETNGFPIGLRYIDISDSVLRLNEEPLDYPISYDSKRGMRETARYNTIEGAKHDVRNSDNSLDGIDPSHTCDNLCMPLDGEICEVNANFVSELLTEDFGTRRFQTVQTAIEHCVSTTLPMPIKLVLDEGDSEVLINKEHIENIFFNATKDIKFYGTISKSGGSRIVLVGRHIIKTGQSNKLFMEDLEFLIDDARVPDRTKPLFILDNPTGTINYQMKFDNVIMSTDLDPLNNGVINSKVSANSIEFRNVIIEKGFFTLGNLGIIDLQTYSTNVLISNLETAYSNGSAIDIRNAGGKVEIHSSTFKKCAVGAWVSQNSCVFIEGTGNLEIFTSNNLITRSGAIIKSNESGLYFSGLIYKTDIDVFDINQVTTLRNIKSWTMNENIPVGIRIVGINFTGGVLSLSQMAQKIFIRKISSNNPGIESTFHDIVINEKDNEIVADPGNNERLFCTKACPFGNFNISQTFIYVGIGGVAGIVLLIIILISCPFIFKLLITGKIGGFQINQPQTIRLRRKKKAREKYY